jgi:hypothetical protein
MWKHVDKKNCCLLAVSDSLMYHLEGSWRCHWHEALVTSCSQSFSQGASVLRRCVETFLSHVVEWLDCLDPKILDRRPERTTSCSFESSELTREVEKNGREKWRKSDSGHLQEHACAPAFVSAFIENLWLFYDSSTTLWTLWTDFIWLRSVLSVRSASMCHEANISPSLWESGFEAHETKRHKRHDIPYPSLSLYLKGPVMQEGVQTHDIDMEWHGHQNNWRSPFLIASSSW